MQQRCNNDATIATMIAPMIATMITANRLFEVSDFSFAISTVFSKKFTTL